MRMRASLPAPRSRRGCGGARPNEPVALRHRRLCADRCSARVGLIAWALAGDAPRRGRRRRAEAPPMSVKPKHQRLVLVVLALVARARRGAARHVGAAGPRAYFSRPATSPRQGRRRTRRCGSAAWSSKGSLKRDADGVTIDFVVSDGKAEIAGRLPRHRARPVPRRQRRRRRGRLEPDGTSSPTTSSPSMTRTTCRRRWPSASMHETRRCDDRRSRPCRAVARRGAGRAAAGCAALGGAAAGRADAGAVRAGRGGAGRCCAARLRGADLRCSCAPTCRSRWSPRTATVAKPWLYKFAGAWGNHEGSMLLWVTVLALAGAVVALIERRLAERHAGRDARRAGRVGARLLSPSCCSPRTRSSGSIPAPLEGSGLNPLLQDPGLAFHPPTLYLGYVGLSVAFSLRGRRAAHAAGRPGVRPGDAAVGARRLDLPDARHHRRQLLGLLRARLGRLVVLGPGRERLADAVAGGDRAAPFASACSRRATGLRAWTIMLARGRLLDVDDRHLPGPLGHPDQRPRLRGRSAARHLHPRPAGDLHRRRAGAVRAARRARCSEGAPFELGQPRRRAGDQQSAAVGRSSASSSSARSIRWSPRR